MRPGKATSKWQPNVAIKNAIANYLILVNNHINKVRTDTLSIRIVDLQNIKQGSKCFSDASFTNLKGHSFQGGFNILAQITKNKESWESILATETALETSIRNMLHNQIFSLLNFE